jgi:hypothetical protein
VDSCSDLRTELWIIQGFGESPSRGSEMICHPSIFSQSSLFSQVANSSTCQNPCRSAWLVGTISQ